MFITFEGIDRSGKSTQAILLHNYLSGIGYRTKLIREPGGTRVSEKIRKILLDKSCKPMDFLTEFLLFSASRKQLTEEVIKPCLNQGVIVICDRYFDSSTAYQGYGGKVDMKIISMVNKISSAGVKPDLTFLIDITYPESIKRKGLMSSSNDRIEDRRAGYFNKVIKGYRELAKVNSRIVKLNGLKPVNEIHNKIKLLITGKLKSLS
ncbi:MAG: dTMP kinase [Ignavibacteriaceae bacterium]|jgi:dTMP kinase|nr:MAG: thymidylate kinase [Chlorobi bacterium OLB4]MBW7854668.1 dTMP kinase [Ignavibacteria bacterium]MEB2330126.1 dTMP kinase [Ignavibacteriaceae bacterium]OQY78188.1 MAG: dTMP kinase [Ignavibacteriales bacterium UTCHB1]